MKKLTSLLLFCFISICLPSIIDARSSFSAAILVDDQIITYYDIEQKGRLLRSFSGEKISDRDIKEVLIKEKIQDLYSKRLNIKINNDELELEIKAFLKGNNISFSKLSQLLDAKQIDYSTFVNFIKTNSLWQKVLSLRFGQKISNLDLESSLPLPYAPIQIEKEYEFSEIYISFQRWGKPNSLLLADRLFIELNSGSNFDEAAKKFSSSATRDKSGFAGSVRAKNIPIEIKKILDDLKKNQVSRPFETKEGFWIFKLHKRKSYKNVKNPLYLVTFTKIPKTEKGVYSCSKDFEKYLSGPLATPKVEKGIREIINKLMPGDSHDYIGLDNTEQVITLCERNLAKSQIGNLNFEVQNKNQEVLRLSNSLLIELRRTTTIVKK